MRSRRVRGVVAIALGILVLVFVADRVTSSPRVCGSCHEMAPRVAAWEQSGHSAIPCVDCHTTPGPWYTYPRQLAERFALLGRDVYRHAAGEYEDPVDARLPGAEPMADAVCLQCHQPDRKATSGFRIKIDHVEHAEANGSCVSCHVRTAHPELEKGRALSLMAQCYTCHGTAEYPEATTECDACHPGGYELVPASHKEAEWERKHGRTATSDEGQCALCHEPSVCAECHGVEMPHPNEWERGTSGHAAVALEDRAVCDRCHAEKPDICAMCHHRAYDPSRGSWIQQHFLEVRDKGARFCFECHAPVFCADCHVRWSLRTGEGS